LRLQFSSLEHINPEAMLGRFMAPCHETSPVAHENLDWPPILDAIAQRCRSLQSQQMVKRFPSLEDPTLVARRLTEVLELIECFDSGDSVVSIVIGDMDDILLRAERGAILSGEELLIVAANLKTYHATKNFFRVRQEEAPLSWAYAQDIEEYRDVERRLTASFTPDGSLVDDASPELATLRERSRRLGESLRTRIESRLTQADVQELVQDSYYTQREGRYVLPIKAQLRSRIAGIVHATSASGQTVFVEPNDLVELNNALRISDFSIEAEEQRILQMLTLQVGALRESLLANTRRCLYLDALTAVARFSIDTQAHVPDLSDTEIELYQARHPLLALRHFENPESLVVANDIMLDGPARSLVISGANAGGKTINLKTVGLFALMLKSGIPICAGASSAMPVFSDIFADIGDEQSIAENISTFSAHIRRLAHALPKASQQTLFLLDEPFSGTDPEHAAPLVMALLNYLHANRATALLTTHFENVKAFALQHSWITTACVSFDFQAMRPTYKLRLGQPGTSAAFEIAAQHGLPTTILDDAKHFFDAKAMTSLETAIARLEQQRVTLENERTLLAQSQADLDEARAQTEALREKIRAQVAQSLGQDIAKAQEDVKNLKTRLKKLRHKSYTRETFAQTEAQEALGQDLAQIDNALKQEKSAVDDLTAPPFEPMPERLISIGKVVHIKPYRKNATVLSRAGNQVTLQLGILQVRASLTDLGFPLQEDDPKASSSGQRKLPKTAKLKEIPYESSVLVDETTQLPLLPQISSNTLDLRGLHADDAIERIEFFLDSMRIQDQPMAYIIHGHGTGILKNQVRQFLNRANNIKTSRPGQYYEGGDGVTLAWLRND